MIGLTVAMKATLKTAALAESTIASAITSGNDKPVTDWLNAAPTTTYWVARPDVLKRELYKLPSGAGVYWDWALFKANSAGEQAAWREMFEGPSSDILDMSQSNVLAGMVSILGGSNANTVHAKIIGRRPATNAEKALATVGAGWPSATGNIGTSTNPAVMLSYGSVTALETSQILRP